ncbi:MAG: hypothetical protein KGS44_14500 [Alphaproteobacteria bacterium]|nr:hypothetical protein [Alphaproteobacteria bacterium]
MFAKGSSPYRLTWGAAQLAAALHLATLSEAQADAVQDRDPDMERAAAEGRAEAAQDPDPEAERDLPAAFERRRPGLPPAAPVEIPLDPTAISPLGRLEIAPCEPGTTQVFDVLAPCAPPISDRWRLAETLGLVQPRLIDPYNQNTLKGDRPLPGTYDRFLVLTGVSDTVVEPRSFPIPVGVQTTQNPGSLDVFGQSQSLVLSHTAILSAALIKGSTAYKPPDWEYRIALAINHNHVDVEERRVLSVRPSRSPPRNDNFVGVQELFYDRHLRDVSTRYDFDSIRIGIQPFTADFRGFLFQDNQLGVRLFGTRDNNRWQYNLAAFARLEKDTNSGLNDIGQGIREDYLFVANLFRQDFPRPALTSLVTLAHNVNREGGEIHVDKNGFPARPALIGDLRSRDYDVTYLGYSLDGRLGRVNLSSSLYYAFGENRNSQFTGEATDISAFFIAAEASYDWDWIRVRGSGLFASGDEDPFDGTETGFDAVFENPQFAGADTSYWIRQAVPLIGGSRAVGLSGRNGLLNALRSSKEEGQSNFTNPGLALWGVGADLDVTPPLRISLNAHHLSFVAPDSLEALRMQGDVGRSIGWDVSASAIYRLNFIQNWVFRASAAALAPSDDFRTLYADRDRSDLFYSVLFNATLTF